MRDLRVFYHTSLGAVHAVDGVSFDLRVGERLGRVGEPGSRKSSVAMSLTFADTVRVPRMTQTEVA